MSGGRVPFLSVYGHITVDQILSVKRFPNINETVDVIDKRTVLGGTGTNIAVTAAKLGVPTAICTFVGEDFSSSYEGFMRGTGLIMDDFVKVPDYETSQAIILNNESLEQKVVFYQGPMGNASHLGKVLYKSASESQYVHFCTGEPEYYLSVMNMLSGKGPHMSVDPAQEVYKMWDRDTISRAVDKCDSLFCNDFEAKVIEKYLDIGDVLSINIPVVVRTLGDRGSIAKVEGKLYEIPAVKADKVVDATGAGDAYRAGFYAGLYHGMSIVDSLTVASAVSSFVVEKVGALTNTPTWEQVMERADNLL